MESFDPIVSTLPFKGERTYLHGTDIYNWLDSLHFQLGISDSLISWSLSFHRLIRSQLELCLENNPPTIAHNYQESAATLCIKMDERILSARLMETDQVPTERIPYDEDSISRECTINGAKISVSGPQNYSSIEVAVAMTKALHQTYFAEEKRKWVFARLELDRRLSPEDKDFLEVEIVQSVQSRFSKSRLSTPDGLLGSIYFSVVSL